METKKMSLVNIQGKLTRDEMKNILAGNATLENVDGGPCLKLCTNDSTVCGGDCPDCKKSGSFNDKYCF